MLCDVENVLYVITCNGCGKYYIGQTGGKLRTRRTVHAQQIRDLSTRHIPLSRHLDTCFSENRNFQLFSFFEMNSESVLTRLSKEKYFINCSNPIKMLPDVKFNNIYDVLRWYSNMISFIKS